MEEKKERREQVKWRDEKWDVNKKTEAQKKWVGAGVHKQREKKREVEVIELKQHRLFKKFADLQFHFTVWMLIYLSPCQNWNLKYFLQIYRKKLVIFSPIAVKTYLLYELNSYSRSRLFLNDYGKYVCFLFRGHLW